MALPLSMKARRTREQPISYLMAAAVQQPDLISFAAGLVDRDHLPVDDVRRLVDELLTDPATGKTVLQYGTTHGLAKLRQQLLDRFAELDGVEPGDLNLTADHVVMTTGSQQALYILADVLIDPGDIVIAAAPSYFVFTGTLASLGADVRTVPMDAGGLSVDALDAMLTDMSPQELAKVKFVYVQTYHQNPTGITLAADRRPQLIKLADKWSRKLGRRLILLEDAAYRELNYDGDPPPTLKSLDVGNQFVAHTQTFSKPFTPGIKLGYAILPPDLVDPVLQQKGNHDFGGANLTQHLASRALEDGTYARHVTRLTAGYAKKRDAVLAALDKHLGDVAGVTWTRPTGGLYVWVTLPKGCDARREGPLFQSCLESGVMYVPGDYCYTTDAPPINEFRLSFGHVLPNQINEGINRLATAIGAHVGG